VSIVKSMQAEQEERNLGFRKALNQNFPDTSCKLGEGHSKHPLAHILVHELNNPGALYQYHEGNIAFSKGAWNCTIAEVLADPGHEWKPKKYRTFIGYQWAYQLEAGATWGVTFDRSEFFPSIDCYQYQRLDFTSKEIEIDY
jgi:hypothetical protein